MKSTFSHVTSTGTKLRFEATYSCRMVDDVVDADGYKITLKDKKESTVGSDLRVFVNGKFLDSCWDPSFWGLIDVNGKQKIHGLKIGFVDPADADAYWEWISGVMDAGTDDEVKAHRAEKERIEHEEKVSRAKEIKAAAERQTDIPPRAEAERRMWEWNEINNQGGEGFVPHIYSREEYDSAISVLAEDRR